MTQSTRFQPSGTLEQILGDRVVKASSSLGSFAVELESGRGLLFSASDGSGRPEVVAELVDACNLPSLAEAVCTVDWSWIEGSKIAEAGARGPGVKIVMEPAGPLEIGVGVWQSKPYLFFQPYKPATT